jgi:hypothetical protein
MVIQDKELKIKVEEILTERQLECLSAYFFDG